MERYYFTFPFRNVQHHNCYHVEEAETYCKARNKMVEKFGMGWAFQYNEIEWRISKGYYVKMYSIDPMLPDWFEGMTQADLFNLKEI